MTAQSRGTYVRLMAASQLLGVSIQTLREWDRKGWLPAERTHGGHRIWRLSLLQKMAKQLESERAAKV